MPSARNRAVTKIKVIVGTTAAIFFLVAGGLLWKGYDFATSQVKSELAAQKIYFPAKGSPALDPKKYPDLQKYAGQLVDNGPKAKAYANGYIGRHLEEVADGKTYAEVSSAAMKDPNNQTLQQQKQSLFMGETLRGLLLGNGYAFWTFGLIAKYAAIGAFVASGLVFALVYLVLRRSR